MPGSNFYREKILDAGGNLIYQQGYHATGIAQMAEVTKGSFFNYFKTKEDFAIIALQEYTEGM